MADLENSRRRLDKVTYTPLVLPESNEGGGALETAAAVGGLGLIAGEATAAAHTPAERVTPTLSLMEELTDAQDPTTRLAASGKLAQTSNAVLTAAVDVIHMQRERILTDTFNDLSSLIREYQAVQHQSSHQGQGGNLEHRLLDVEQQLSHLLAPAQGTSLPVSPLISAASRVNMVQAPAALPAVQIPDAVAARLGSALATDAWAAVNWADKDQPERARHLTGIPAVVIPDNLRAPAAQLLMAGLPFLIDQARKTAVVKSALTRRKLQPIGLLHLEQLVMTPLEIERGELLYSLPLAPLEKVTLSHKEWSLRQEEYTRFVQDYFENYSERGVAEKSDIAVSTKSETEHTKTLSMSRPTAPGGATLADAVDTQTVAGDVTKESQSQESSRRDTREITEKASSLSIRDQRVSFTVTTVSGTEDFTSRLYENKYENKVMLIDYFRRMRKWRNQLFRTGVRLTYDVVLPDPGRRLRERWQAVEAIDTQLNAPFEFALANSGFNGVIPSTFTALSSFSVAARASSNFATSLSSLLDTRDNIERLSVDQIESLGRQYGVTLPPAPDTLTSVDVMKPVPPTAAGKNSVSFDVTVPIQSGYRPTKLWIGGRLANGNDDQYMVADYWSRQTVINADEKLISQPFTIKPEEFASNSIPVGFIVYNGAVGEARVSVGLAPTPAAWRTWRSTVLALLRQGALSRWNEKREVLRQQRAALLKELEAPDTLTLRRMEREQIMYLVLEWLFPDFGQSVEVYQALAANKPNAWQTVLEYGEYIKLVQEAIDWDQILVLLYPYFWDRPENHAEKLYLDHPDATHREFLRAGATRVILAVRPGFEESVVSLLDKGELGQLAPASRFRPVIDAVHSAQQEFNDLQRQATALPAHGQEVLANRQGLPGSLPSPGILIGEWFDWTPTSALDMDVTLKNLIEPGQV